MPMPGGTRRHRLVIAGMFGAPAIARPRQRRRELAANHRLSIRSRTRSRIRLSIGSNQSSKSWDEAVEAVLAPCKKSDFMVAFVMA